MKPEDFSIVPALKQTLRLSAAQSQDVSLAAQLLRRGATVAFPTETVYGLGANALDAEAVLGIFAAKQRPSWDPLIVHIGDRAMLSQITSLPAGLRHRAELLMSTFWPGPLTLLLPRSAAIPDAVTAGRDRVGVRVPANPVALALLAEAGIPIAAPSANRFGHTSPTTAAHVLDDLDGRIDAVLDGGATSIGVESTVLDLCETPLRLYRPGAVTLDQIASIAGPVEVVTIAPSAAGAEPRSLPSPGLDLRHYAPSAHLRLVEDAAALRAALEEPSTTGVMLPDGWDGGAAAYRFAWGPWDQPAILAQRLFAGLRDLDAHQVTTILCPLPGNTGGLTAALRDRLLKAARSR